MNTVCRFKYVYEDLNCTCNCSGGGIRGLLPVDDRIHV